MNKKDNINPDEVKDLNSPDTPKDEKLESAEETLNSTEIEDNVETDEVSEETPESSEEENKKTKKPKMDGIKKAVSGNKFKRSTISIASSIIFVAIIIVVNFLVSALVDKFPSLNVDLTAEKMNTLSEQAEEIAKDIQDPTEIIIIADENAARTDGVVNYFKYSQVTNLADKLAELNSNISVSFVDPDANPAFINEYPDDSLTTGTVMVKTDKRYRVLSLTDLYTVSQNSTTGAYDYYSQVDSALANALYLANLDEVPVLAVATGHNEMLAESYLSTGLEVIASSLSLEVQYFDILTEEIPEDTQVLMIPTATTDYTSAEIDKLRDFVENEGDAQHSIIYTSHPTQGELPNLASFLEEWGVSVDSGVVAETDTGYIASAQSSAAIFANSAGEILTDNSYPRLITINNSPLSLLFSSNNDISTYKLWVTSPGAYVVEEESSDSSNTSEQTLATLSKKSFSSGNFNSVIVFGSTESFLDTYSNNSTFSNKQYLTDLLSYVASIDESPVIIEQVQTNTIDISASASTIKVVGLGVFTIGIPVIILVIGLVIFLRRRHL